VSVNEKKWLVMHMHVQLKLDELRGPPNPAAAACTDTAAPAACKTADLEAMLWCGVG
jgi:hypothetical protein